MEKQQVYAILAEVCEDDILLEEHDLDIFEEGLLDSFGTINLLMAFEEQLNITVPITEFNCEEWNTANRIAEKLAEFE